MCAYVYAASLPLLLPPSSLPLLSLPFRPQGRGKGRNPACASSNLSPGEFIVALPRPLVQHRGLVSPLLISRQKYRLDRRSPPFRFTSALARTAERAPSVPPPASQTFRGLALSSAGVLGNARF